jgi:hypothetical protein
MTSEGRRLHTLVLRLYPGEVRRRYEPEIRELLETSPNPVRDLADVARSGLRERVTVAVSRPPSRGYRWMTSMSATMMMQGAPLALAGGLPWAAMVVGLVSGLMLTCRGAGLKPALLVTSGVLFLYLMPHIAESLTGERNRTPELISTAAFGVAVFLLAPLLRARPGNRVNAAVGAVGMLALPLLATTLFATLRRLDHPWLSYWGIMAPRAPFTMDDVLAYYPALYTCCAFLLLAGAAVANGVLRLRGQQGPTRPVQPPPSCRTY